MSPPEPVPSGTPSPDGVAAHLLAGLAVEGQTLAVAESLTGGAVLAALVAVPGASAVLRGGVVAYATDLKTTLAGVPAELLAERGAVDRDVARAMAAGVRERLGADWGLGTTGVAGPDPQDGKAPGTFHVAVVGPGVAEVFSVEPEPRRAPARAEIRAAAVLAVLMLAGEMVGNNPAGPGVART